MFQRPLICTDFTDGLQRLVHFVPSLAAGGMKHLIFFHSAPLWTSGEIPRVDTEKVEAAQQKLSAALSSVPQGVEVKVDVQSGKPTDTILRAVKTHQADVILLGSVSRNLLAEKLFGSTTQELSQRSPVPLLVIRPQMISIFTTEELDLRCRHLFRCLLVPYDGSQGAKHLVNQVQQTFHSESGNSLERCVLSWVVDDCRRRELPADYQQKIAEEGLVAPVQQLEQLGLKVVSQIREGDPVSEILEAALESDISAIALAADRSNKLLEWSVPSFTAEILRRSWYPVLYFPSGS